MCRAEREVTKKCIKCCFFQKSAGNFGLKMLKNYLFFIKNAFFPADLPSIIIYAQKIQKTIFSMFSMGNETYFFKLIFSKNFFVKFFSTWKTDIFSNVTKFLKKCRIFFEQTLHGELRLHFHQKTIKILSKKALNNTIKWETHESWIRKKNYL